jgi:hypothetical protein
MCRTRSVEKLFKSPRGLLHLFLPPSFSSTTICPEEVSSAVIGTSRVAMDILHGVFVPRLTRQSTPVNGGLSGGASSFRSAVGSSVNAESSSVSFKALVSSTILYFGWPIAASVLTSRGVSFDLLWLAMVKLTKRLANGPCMLARLSLRTREPAGALII